MADQTPHHHFENNPFFIVANGITRLANLAQSLFVLFIVFSIVGLFGSSFTPYPTDISATDFVSTIQTWSPSTWLTWIGSGFILGLAAMLIAALFGGVSSYTSARLAQGKSVHFTAAFRVALDNIWPYFWLQILIMIKVFLWTLLLVVPGIIMSVRYSLAGVAFYDDKKHLRGNAAIKESIRLTKNAWITTYASNVLFNILTLGAIPTIVTTGASATLYRQFQQVGDKKPKAHWLSWLTLILPLVLLAVIVFVAMIVAIVVAIPKS